MVISFSDSMQLTFAIRDRLVAGQQQDASRCKGALAVVGPACVLTHTTTMVSFVALLFSDSDLIRTFGEAGLLTTAIALVTVLVLLPLLAVALVRGEAKLAQSTARADTAINLLRGFCRWIAERMVSHPGLYSVISIVVCVLLSLIYTQSAAALSARRPGAQQRAGGDGQRLARSQADRGQPDRRADRNPQGRGRCTRPATLGDAGGGAAHDGLRARQSATSSRCRTLARLALAESSAKTTSRP